MPPIRHVAVLAPESSRTPLLVGILERLAVKREPVGVELVTARAELGPQKGRRARDAPVWEALARRTRGRRAVPAWWAEVLVASHVTTRADDAAGLKLGIEGGVG